MTTPAQIPLSDSGRIAITTEELLVRLKTALARDGDFPASARAVAELKALAANPNTTTEQITEIILTEPSLGARVLHLVNSTYFRRSKPIMTISQAVIRIGMKQLSDMCGSLMLLQKFIPVARQGGPFATCLQQLLTTSLLSGSLSQRSAVESSRSAESGYLAGSFAEIGPVLLSYYFPKVYEAALKRSVTKDQELSRSLKEITGLSSAQLSFEVIDALNLPQFYKKVLECAESVGQLPPSVAFKSNTSVLPGEKDNIERVGRGLLFARAVSETVSTGRGKDELDAVLARVSAASGIDQKACMKAVGELPELFKAHCSLIELNLPLLPEYITNYVKTNTPLPKPSTPIVADESFSRFIDEIKQAVENKEPSASIITSVMESLAFGLKFDRVLLLLANPARSALTGRMLLGESAGSTDARSITRPLGSGAGAHSPDANAFHQGRPVYTGDPVLPRGWPLVAIPIGSGKSAIGVIYADRTSDESPLSPTEEASVSILADLLERSLQAQVKTE